MTTPSLHLNSPPAPISPTPTPTLRRARFLHVAGAVIFCLWNFLFLALIFFGIVPEILVGAFTDALQGRLPWDLLATGLLLTAIPIASVAWAWRLRRARSGHLLALFYGLEAPLCLLAAARIFLVRELNPGVTLVLACFFTGASCFAIELGGGIARRRWARAAQVAGHTVGLLACVYLGTLLAFYALPAGAAALNGLVRLSWIGGFFAALIDSRGMMLLYLPLAALTATLFLVTPLALPWLYARSLARVLRAHRPALGLAAAFLPAAAVAAVAALFVLVCRQPQPAAFAALARPPASDAERARLLASEDDLRAGLLNAYLAPYRYLGARGAAHDLESIYQQLGLSAPASVRVQQAFLALAAPFIYDGQSAEADAREAERLYAAFFDAPIQKREQQAVLHATTATYSRTHREAGHIDRNRRLVRLARQQVAVTEHGPAAEIEIHDRWENQTFDPAEVVLTFALPEEAAVTGLWLANSDDDRSKRWAAVVSPRGAAQAVYRQEIRRSEDPALLEQIGPRQYRLRIFPVPARVGGGAKVTPLHVWLTYVTFAHHSGVGVGETASARAPSGCAWPLPRLAERRNGFWDARTERLVRGAPRENSDGPVSDDDWTGSAIACQTASTTEAPLAIMLAAGAPGDAALRTVRRQPRDGGGARDARDAIQWATGRRLAVVIDRSYSMRRHAAALAAELDWIARAIAARADVDLYLTTAGLRGEPARRIDDPALLRPDALTFFGGATLGDLLDQADRLAGPSASPNPPYDAVLLLTDDDGGADRTGPDAPPRDGGLPSGGLRGPLWLIHLGGALPAGYDDAVTARLQQSRGGIAGSTAEALARQAALGDPSVVSAHARAVWTIDAAPTPARAPAPAAISAPPWLAQLGARQLILAETRLVAASTGAATAGDAPAAARRAALDRLHALAVRYRVVSPYSSMIVLVDDRQRQALLQAEQADDRFDRDADPASKAFTKPFSPFGLAATPEPHEWILIGVAALAVGMTIRNRRARRHLTFNAHHG